ncbi:three component ABC system middle component [Flavobacterium covae]|uniref:three component ABC system middle component n=1 Tax=Flavobacterium covae TaxID=2906076 RepID=UPI0035E434FD
MKEIYYTYNNEAISSCIILSVLNKVDKLDIARSCLILPFLLDDRTVNYLTKTRGENLSIEHLLKDQPRLFVSFNKRYVSLLPITINSLIILSKSNQIIIGSEIVKTKTFTFDNTNLGDRFSKIENVIPDFIDMFEKYTTSKLYKVLKIQL